MCLATLLVRFLVQILPFPFLIAKNAILFWSICSITGRFCGELYSTVQLGPSCGAVALYSAVQSCTEDCGLLMLTQYSQHRHIT
jgi:hypothetical protein